MASASVSSQPMMSLSPFYFTSSLSASDTSPSQPTTAPTLNAASSSDSTPIHSMTHNNNKRQPSFPSSSKRITFDLTSDNDDDVDLNISAAAAALIPQSNAPTMPPSSSSSSSSTPVTDKVECAMCLKSFSRSALETHSSECFESLQQEYIAAAVPQNQKKKKSARALLQEEAEAAELAQALLVSSAATSSSSSSSSSAAAAATDVVDLSSSSSSPPAPIVSSSTPFLPLATSSAASVLPPSSSSAAAQSQTISLEPRSDSAKIRRSAGYQDVSFQNQSFSSINQDDEKGNDDYDDDDDSNEGMYDTDDVAKILDLDFSSSAASSSSAAAASSSPSSPQESEFQKIFNHIESLVVKETRRIESKIQSVSAASAASADVQFCAYSLQILAALKHELGELDYAHRHELFKLEGEKYQLRSQLNQQAEEFTRERLSLEEQATGKTMEQQEELSKILIEQMEKRDADAARFRMDFKRKEDAWKKERQEMEQQVASKMRMVGENKQLMMVGEEIAIATGLGEVKRISLLPSSNFAGQTPEEFHFRLAESQFYRMCSQTTSLASVAHRPQFTGRSQFRITRIEFLLNPALLKQFHDFKKEAAARGESCEEHLAYHGTSSDVVDKIVQEGFKIGGIDVGIASGNALGLGVYCSESPTFAMRYIRQQVSESNVKNGSSLLFARVCRTRDTYIKYEPNSHVIEQMVCKNKNQIYPQYIVHFTWEDEAANAYGYARPIPAPAPRMSIVSKKRKSSVSATPAAAVPVPMPMPVQVVPVVASPFVAPPPSSSVAASNSSVRLNALSLAVNAQQQAYSIMTRSARGTPPRLQVNPNDPLGIQPKPYRT